MSKGTMIHRRDWQKQILVCAIAAISWSLQGGTVLLAQSPSLRKETAGFAQPWRLIDVAVAVPGRVADVQVVEGDAVEEGALIAKLDDRVLRASLEVANQRASATGEEDAARARLNHAAKRRNDFAALLHQSHASQTELDQAELAVREAEAAVLSAQERSDIAAAEVARIQAELTRQEVRSPVNGFIIEVNRRKGEYAGSNDPVIAKIAVLDRLRLRLNVPTSVAIGLSKGSEIVIEFPEIQAKASGRVDFVSPVTDSESGTVRIDIQLDNRSGTLRSGLLGIWKYDSRGATSIQPTEKPTDG